MADQPYLCDLFLHPGVFLPEQLQAVVAGRGQMDGLQEQRVGERLAQQQAPPAHSWGQQLLGRLLP